MAQLPVFYQMAQTFASTPQAIYDALVADTSFMAQVGTYTFQSGDTAPSISIVTPGADLPEVASQEGLEVVIQDVADVDTRLYLTNNPDILVTWKVFLIIWSGADGSTAMAAVTRLIELFPLATTIQTVSSGSVLGVDFQLQARIPSDSPILT